jgi:arylsulfatase A-like enzyme
MISRRRFLSNTAITGAAAIAGLQSGTDVAAKQFPAAPSTGVPKPGSPNVLIFMPDQQNGATVLPGSPVIKPNMDRFLQQAIAFNSAYCPAPHCCPSRASFMSGLYPSEHGVYNNVTTETAIHPNPYPATPFWGLTLRDAGYALAYSGKIHVGRDVTPETCGFENLSNLEQDHLQDNDDKKKRLWQQARNETTNPAERKPGEYLRPDWTNGRLYGTRPNEGPNGYDTLADARIMQAGIAGVKRLAAAGKPWCVMISNSGGHDPYEAPRKFVDMYDLEKIELPSSFKDTLDDKPRIYQRQRYQHWSQLSDDESRDALRHYYAKCTLQDALFGDMLRALEETGQVDNTIVIYVSDHGDYHGAHGLWMKGVPSFSEAYHIPAVIRWPRMLRNPGRQVDAFVDQVDWAPTILEACGVMSPKKLSGDSLLPWLRGETPVDWRTATCAQLNGVELYYTQRITMTKDWKYVYNGFDYDELYDLRNDPHEMHNLAFPNLAAKRSEVLAGHGLPKNGTVPWPPLPDAAAAARKDLLGRMWTFAVEHHDIIFNQYGTVSLAPFGPGLGPAPEGENMTQNSPAEKTFG